MMDTKIAILTVLIGIVVVVKFRCIVLRSNGYSNTKELRLASYKKPSILDSYVWHQFFLFHKNDFHGKHQSTGLRMTNLFF